MMMTFSMSLSLTSPPTSNSHGGSGDLRRYFTLYSSWPALIRPAVHGLAQLNVRVDPDGYREPEADHPEQQHRRDRVLHRNAEQRERADHPGVDGAHSAGR